MDPDSQVETSHEKSTRIDVGNARAWVKAPFGWVELPTVHVGLVYKEDVDLDPNIRRLTPAEVERAERGLGPYTERPIDDMSGRDIENELRDIARGFGLDRARADAYVNRLAAGDIPAGMCGRVLALADEHRRISIATAARWSAREVTTRAEEPGCGGPKEACAVPGCDECGAPVARVHVSAEFAPGPTVAALPALVVVDPETGARHEVADGQTIIFTAKRTVEPNGAERATWVSATPREAVVISTPTVPPGLSPEQATRYLDATTTALRQLVAQASIDFCEASIAFSSAPYARDPEKAIELDLWLYTKEIHRALVGYLSSWIGYGIGPDVPGAGDEPWRRGEREAYNRAAPLFATLAGGGS